jgi:adenylate cyclase
VRAGDYYGHSVNLASRVTGVARPGSVLCTQEVRDAAADDYDWSRAGRYRLKGVSGQTPLFRARRRTETG